MNSKTAKPRYVIYAPKGLRTGGPEAMHQLHWAINQHGEKSLLLPYPGTKKLLPVSDYAKYSPSWCRLRDLNKEDILIVGETISYLPFWYFIYISKKNIRKWMLSVEFSSDSKFNRYERKNFKLHSEWELPLSNSNKLKKILRKILFVRAVRLIQINFRILRGRFLKKNTDVQDKNFIFQSNYAKKVFQAITNTNYGNLVTDFTESVDSSQIDRKEFCLCIKSHVSYFPGKSKELIPFILDINRIENDQIHFIAVSGLSQKEVFRVFALSDLYLDLGYFPGKDRLPREAIRMDCPVLIAKRGSARYHEDFPLEENFLLDLELLNPKSLYNSIIKILSYGKKSNLLSQEKFKNSVLNEKDLFLKEVKQFLLR